MPRPASADRIAAILGAALECYEELGWSATTIADIRRRSGASTGSIYHHFGDKEGIAAALYLETLERYRRPLRERLSRSRTARGTVRGIVLHHIEWAAENPTWARYLMEMRGSEAVKRAEAELKASNRLFLEEIRAHLQRWIDAGDLLDLPHVLYAPLLIGPAADVVRWWLRGRIHQDLESLAKPLADAAWRALSK